jgi:prophage DNA circulation protein
MDKADALEAAEIVGHCCDHLIKTVAQYGRPGSDAREQISQTKARAYQYLRADTIGPELDRCFELARQAGANVYQMETVRVYTSMEKPVTLGATLIQNSLIQWCLAEEAAIIADMTFISRQDIDRVKKRIGQPFEEAEEQAADDMDQAVFRGLIALQGATVQHLVVAARPLPQMLDYQFAAPSNTLVISYRLYSDAGRSDQVRDENKIIHPAFAPATGQALSA